MILACSLSIGFWICQVLGTKPDWRKWIDHGNVNIIIMLKRSIFLHIFTYFISSWNEPTTPTNAPHGMDGGWPWVDVLHPYMSNNRLPRNGALVNVSYNEVILEGFNHQKWIFFKKVKIIKYLYFLVISM